jgi:bacterioferritin
LIVAGGPNGFLEKNGVQHVAKNASNGGKGVQNGEAVKISREQLIELLNGDLAREYQAIIAYVIYSQAIKGAQYMDIAAELEVHAGEELQHAISIAKQIDYLGGKMTAEPEPVATPESAVEMLRADLRNELDTIANYRIRLRQAETLDEYAISETIREILVQEQEHAIDLATALGIDVPKATLGGKF